jgi:hypothetical protein
MEHLDKQDKLVIWVLQVHQDFKELRVIRVLLAVWVLQVTWDLEVMMEHLDRKVMQVNKDCRVFKVYQVTMDYKVLLESKVFRDFKACRETRAM